MLVDDGADGQSGDEVPASGSGTPSADGVGASTAESGLRTPGTTTVDEILELALDDPAGVQEGEAPRPRRMLLVPGLPVRKLDRVCRRINRGTEVGQRSLAFYL